MKPLLVSVHIPKTGGNSFLQALGATFGASLIQDYSDMSSIQEYLAGELEPRKVFVCSPVTISPTARCIHGHFLPAKLLPLKDKYEMRFVTWLRNPVDRLFSHYNFFRRSYERNTAGPLFRRIIEENWSLEQFCFSEEYKNLYHKYLWNFPYENFDFVGLTEFYEDDLEFFSQKFLGSEVQALRLNCADTNDSTKLMSDLGLRREVETFHSQDMALYNRALSDRLQRI